MDATTRWETEAIRASASQRSNPPRPSAKRSGAATTEDPTIRQDARWVTLKEAEAATQIPSNTIRKWVRKGTVDSYLESDGHLALRMIDMDSLLARAKALGRTVTERDIPEPDTDIEAANADTATDAPVAPSDDVPEPVPPSSVEPEGTMLVPIDAWNKMLNQLGNLHEAGQQLAEARERAAKAETEAVFLRERLAEMRESRTTDDGQRTTDPEPDPTATSVPLSRGAGEQSEPGGSVERSDTVSADKQPDPTSVPLSRGTGEQSEPGGSREQSHRTDAGEQSEPGGSKETTTYWRYISTGWRDRKRRRRG